MGQEQKPKVNPMRLKVNCARHGTTYKILCKKCRELKRLRYAIFPEMFKKGGEKK